VRNAITVTTREFKAFFVSPVAYAVSFFFLLIMGIYFYFITVLAYHEASLHGLLGVLGYLCIPMAAVITMHLFADERRSGTIELLMTYPINDWEVVLGKYIASLLLFMFVLLLSLQFPLFLLAFGSPDLGMILSGYLGAFLLGAAFIAMGILASSLTRSSVVSAIICLLVLFGLRLLAMGSLVGGPVGRTFYYLSFSGQFSNLLNGLIDTRDIVFILSFIVFTLFAAVRVIEINRWK